MQNGISTGLIYTGAVVKDSPNTNAVDLILQTESANTSVNRQTLISPVTVVNEPQPPVQTVAPNVAVIADEKKVSDNNVLIYAGLGLGALLLFSPKAQKAVTGIGKAKNDSSILPLLIAAGAAVWYFTKDSNQAPTPAAAQPAGTTQPTGIAHEAPTTAPVPVLQAPEPVQTMIRSQVAQNNLSALQSMFPQYQTIYTIATDAEIITLYQYLVGWVANGQKLYRLPGQTGLYPDGSWNTALYDAVAAVKAKYSLNI